MQKQKWMAALLCAALTLGLAACGANKGAQNGDAPVPPAQGETMGAMEAYTPAPMNMTPEAEEKYPYMGVTLRLPEKLLAAILEDKVFMYSGEDLEYTDLTDLSGPIPADWYPTPENMLLHSGYIEFTYLPENMREEIPSRKNPMTYDQFTAWIAEAQPMARLDMVRAESLRRAPWRRTATPAMLSWGSTGAMCTSSASTRPRRTGARRPRTSLPPCRSWSGTSPSAPPRRRVKTTSGSPRRRSGRWTA